MIHEFIQGAKRIGITGHVRPDGDCTGACLGLYQYILNCGSKEEDCEIDVFLEYVQPNYAFLQGSDDVILDYPDKEPYDLFFCLDCGSIDRTGNAEKYLKEAKRVINIDHHISNTGFAKEAVIKPEASSTCEVLYELAREDMINKACAEAWYLGIVHDTGVFKHSNTTEKTMMIAGKLISKGANPSYIIDHTFYEKTYLQNQVLGRCLLESILCMDGKVIIGLVSKKVMDFYGIGPGDTDGIIDQLRVTAGVEVAIFIREDGVQEYKVSMRSNGIVDVAKIAVFFGGGGHVKAAGCSMKGSYHDVINNITIGIEHQLKQHQK